MDRRSANTAEDSIESSAIALSGAELLKSLIGLARHAKALVEQASEPAASLQLARAIVALKSGSACPTIDKDTDVIHALMRTELRFLIATTR